MSERRTARASAPTRIRGAPITDAGELVRSDRCPAEVIDRNGCAAPPRSLSAERRRKLSRRRATGRRASPANGMSTACATTAGSTISIYAKPQLVDGESIMFCMRALLELHKTTGRGDVSRRPRRRAAELVVTWICLWDVPLPPRSTLARYGFRSTGWMACDAPGAGYIHPMGVLAVPDLVEIGLLTGERVVPQGCRAAPGRLQRDRRRPPPRAGATPTSRPAGGGLARSRGGSPTTRCSPGPAFGGRGKGEGNKTCLPWISAVGAYAAHENGSPATARPTSRRSPQRGGAPSLDKAGFYLGSALNCESWSPSSTSPGQ